MLFHLKMEYRLWQKQVLIQTFRVTQEYQYENGDVQFSDTATNVLVWSNENYEDYTHKFTVPERPDMLDESWENY